MSSGIQFGTDGWRAIIAEDFTVANVKRVSQAAADFWRANPPPGTHATVVVGYDRRFMSDEFARTSAEVLAANGFTVLLTPVPTPTPAISFAVKQHRAAGGIMITASHNPPMFNGFKLKGHYGGSADTTICQGVEGCLNGNGNPIDSTGDALSGNAENPRIKVLDLRPAHYAAAKSLVDFRAISRSHIKFAHEALFGVGTGCFDEMLAGTSCKVTTLNGRHDPLFGGINPEPIEKNYALSAAYLRKHPHDLCLVTDGDADRVGAMDGHGNSLSTHQVICLLLHHLAENRQAKGVVVKALTTTSMVDKMCAELGLELRITGVGFKLIVAEMLKGGVMLGAEESGGIAFPDLMPERDGITAGLMLLELLAVERTTLHRMLDNLVRRFGPHRYGRIDAVFPVDKRVPLMESLQRDPPAKLLSSPVEEIKTFDGVKFIARDSSWLMLRGSGTEPVLRIYAEAGTDERVQQLLRLGVRLSRRTL